MTISYSEFKNLSESQQKDVLEKLRTEVGVSGIMDMWGISRSKIYKLIHDLGLSVSSKGRKSTNDTSDSRGKTKSKKPSVIQEDLTEAEVNLASQTDTDVNEGNSMLPSFSVSLTAQGPFQTVSEKLQFLFQQNIVPNTNVRVSINIDEI
jgi:hypothetical protein